MRKKNKINLLKVDAIPVVFVQRDLLPYRDFLYAGISLNIPLTVIHTNDIPKKPYNTLKVKSFQFKGSFIHLIGLKNLINVKSIVMECNIRLIFLWIILTIKLLNPNLKLVLWGNGPSKNRISNFVRKLIYKLPFEHIYYSNREHSFFSQGKPSGKNHHILQNTVKVNFQRPKNDVSVLSLLHIGSLYERKGHQNVLQIIENLCKLGKSVNFTLYGDGPYRNKLSAVARERNLLDNFNMHGPVDDLDELDQIYANHHFTICLKQCGLTAIQSMGYQTPVIALRDAISGGEIYHVKDGETGYLFDTQEEVMKFLLDFNVASEQYSSLRKSCLEYYNDNLHYKNYIKSFVKILS